MVSKTHIKATTTFLIDIWNTYEYLIGDQSEDFCAH